MADFVICPSCQRRLNVPDDLTGQPVRCPTCAATFAALPADAEQPTVDYLPPPGDDLESRLRRDLPPNRGTMILIFGILGIVLSVPSMCCLFVFLALGGFGFSVTAWTLAHNDLRAMRQQQMDPDGRGLTRAGLVCGIVGTLCSALTLAVHGAITVYTLWNAS